MGKQVLFIANSSSSPRVQANHLFCSRSGQVFEYPLQGGSINSLLISLDRQQLVQTIISS